MSVTYSSSVKTSRLTRTQELILSKTAAAATGSAVDAKLVIGTSSLSGATGVLATVTLPNAGVTVSGSVLTLVASTQSATASATGTAALAEVRNDAGTVIASGLTVGTSGTDVIINSTAISSGQTVSLTAATITHG
jgi:hypothetical protein